MMHVALSNTGFAILCGVTSTTGLVHRNDKPYRCAKTFSVNVYALITHSFASQQINSLLVATALADSTLNVYPCNAINGQHTYQSTYSYQH